MHRWVFAVFLQTGLCFCYAQDSGQQCRERYGRAVEAEPKKSSPHYEIALCFAKEKDYLKAANEFREALNGDLRPAWIEVWSHVNLGKIFDTTGQRNRALNEYRLAEENGRQYARCSGRSPPVQGDTVQRSLNDSVS